MENKNLLFPLPHNSRSIIHQLKLSNFKFKIKKWKHSIRQYLTQPEIHVCKNRLDGFLQLMPKAVECSAMEAMFGTEVPKLTEIACIFTYTYFLHSNLPLVTVRDSTSEVSLCSHPEQFLLPYD